MIEKDNLIFKKFKSNKGQCSSFLAMHLLIISNFKSLDFRWLLLLQGKSFSQIIFCSILYQIQWSIDTANVLSAYKSGTIINSTRYLRTSTINWKTAWEESDGYQFQKILPLGTILSLFVKIVLSRKLINIVIMESIIFSLPSCSLK